MSSIDMIVMNKGDTSKFLKNNMSEQGFRKNFQDVYDSIILYFEEYNIKKDITWGEKKWIFCKNLKKIPTCSHCDKPVKYLSPAKGGYSKTCSLSCAKLDVENIKKVKETNILKYGVEYATQSDIVKKKMKDTNMERYGVEYASSNPNISKKIALHSKKNWENTSKAMKLTMLEKYGIDNIFKSEKFKEDMKKENFKKYGVKYTSARKDIQEKIVAKNLINFGVERPAQNEKIRLKMQQSVLIKYGVDNISKHIPTMIMAKEKMINSKKLKTLAEHVDILEIQNETFVCQCKLDHTYTTEKYLFFQRKRFNEDPCTICNDPKENRTSLFQKDVKEYVESLHVDTVLENYNKFGSKLEADVYLQNLKIAIECNGVYWHSELYSGKNKHIDKKNFFEERDIRLLQIWEDDWKFKKDIWKSILKNVLHVPTQKIFSRKCTIIKVNNKEAEVFLLKNHLQGKIRGSHHYGLIYENEIVSLMSFGSLRKSLGTKSKERHFELLRFCNKINCHVPGAASRLLKHFLKEVEVESITSYANKEWATGEMYSLLGFEKMKDTKPGYHWAKNGIRENRFKFRKSELVKMGYDASMTEVEIMHHRGYYRVFDTGQQKWIFKNE